MKLVTMFIMAQTTCFHARMVLLGVRTMGDHIWGICPQNPQKLAWIGNLIEFQYGGRPFSQAKTAKYKNHNNSKTINRIRTKFEDQTETDNCTSWLL